MTRGFQGLEPELPGVLYVLKKIIRELRVASAFGESHSGSRLYPESISWLNEGVSSCQEFCVPGFQFSRPLPHRPGKSVRTLRLELRREQAVPSPLPPPPPSLSFPISPSPPPPRNDHYLGIRKPTCTDGRKQPSSHSCHLCPPILPSTSILHDKTMVFPVAELEPEREKRLFL